LKEAFGNDVKVAALSSGTESTLSFTSLDLTNEATTTTANQPYAIKVASDFTSATINGVNIVAGTPTQSITNWDFVGTYSSKTVPTDSYYFKSNELYKSSERTTIKPFRAYLTYTGGGSPTAPNFVIDGEATGINAVNGSELKVNGEYYNLAGQRVANPTKGLYIVNGKKYMIK
jgi:hypothetical protein